MPSHWDNPSGKIHGHSPEDQRTLYIKTIKPLGQTLGRDSLGQLFTSLINRLPTRSQAPCCIARLGHRWPLKLHLTIQCASAGEPSCPEEIVQVGAGHKPRETVAGDFVLKRLPGEAHTWGFRDEAVMPGASWHRPEAAGSADPTCAKHSGGDCTE